MKSAKKKIAAIIKNKDDKRYHLRRRECPDCGNKLDYKKTIDQNRIKKLVFKCNKCVVLWIIDHWKDNKDWNFFAIESSDGEIEDHGLMSIFKNKTTTSH